MVSPDFAIPPVATRGGLLLGALLGILIISGKIEWAAAAETDVTANAAAELKTYYRDSMRLIQATDEAGSTVNRWSRDWLGATKHPESAKDYLNLAKTYADRGANAVALINQLRAGEAFHWEPKGKNPENKTALKTLAARLAGVQASKSWRQLLVPSSYTLADLLDPSPAFLDQLRRSADDLQAAADGYRAMIDMLVLWSDSLYEAKQRNLALQDSLSKVRLPIRPYLNDASVWEYMDQAAVVYPAENGIAESVQGLRKAYTLELRSIQSQQARRLRISGAIELVQRRDAQRAQIDQRSRAAQMRKRQAENDLNQAQASIRVVDNLIAAQERAAIGAQNRRDAPYTACPNRQPFNTCTHADLKAAYLRNKAAAARELETAQRAIEALNAERRGLATQLATANQRLIAADTELAAAESLRKSVDDDYKQRVTQLEQTASAAFHAAESGVDQLRRQIEANRAEGADMRASFLAESLRRYLQKVAESEAGAAQPLANPDPFRNHPQSGTIPRAESAAPGQRDPFRPSGARNPFDVGPAGESGGLPFRSGPANGSDPFRPR
jgi:hypothetical protein